MQTNSNTKYIAKYVFGSVKGFHYNLKNLKYAVANKSNWVIKDKRLYGFKFIEINEDNSITYFTVSKNPKNKQLWDENTVSVKEFWEITKANKSDFFIIEKR